MEHKQLGSFKTGMLKLFSTDRVTNVKYLLGLKNSTTLRNVSKAQKFSSLGAQFYEKRGFNRQTL